MTIYRLIYKDSFTTDLYFDNYNDAKRNYDEAVADIATSSAKIVSCEFVDGLLTPIKVMEHYEKKEKVKAWRK